ncbi:MAG TPA: DUF2442 domain-containing protein [Actinomycetota bacterium]|nr:DUF2442 domain-containing protein [Actinomycetota bacterium]
MKERYRIPHINKVEVPRPHVLRVTFDDGLIRELAFVGGETEGTVFEDLEDPKFFERVRVDPESGTVVWPNGLDLDPSVLHGDFPPAGKDHFREVSTSGRARLG